MPCLKCSNGKYKMGEDGNCKYSSKENCEKAQQAYHAKQGSESKNISKKLVTLINAFD